jgi:hypothetical protein
MGVRFGTGEGIYGSGDSGIYGTYDHLKIALGSISFNDRPNSQVVLEWVGRTAPER